MTVEFFSEVDKVDGPTGKGQVASTLPAWYFTRNIERLKDDISQTRRRLDQGSIAHNREAQVKADLRRMEKKLSQLQEAMPKIEGGSKDECAAVYKELSKLISEVMPTRDQDRRGLVNPSKLVDMNTQPCIKVSGKVAEIAVKNGYRVSKDGKMSLTDASFIWKTVARVCEEETNTEWLRRDK